MFGIIQNQYTNFQTFTRYELTSILKFILEGFQTQKYAMIICRKHFIPYNHQGY